MSPISKRFSVLIVEDDVSTRTIMSRILTSAGFSVKEAGSAQEALQGFDSSVQLAVIDIGLPSANGLDLVVQLRKRFDKKRLKICFASSQNERETISQGLAAGGDDYLIKPIDGELFLHKVTKLMGQMTSQFAWVGADRSASLSASNVIPEMTIVRVSEVGLLIKANARFVIGAHSQVECASLSGEIGRPIEEIVQRVTSCERIKRSIFFVGTEFVGLAEQLKQPLRSLAIRGKYLSDAATEKKAG